MRRFALITVLLLILIFTLAACGNNGPQDQGGAQLPQTENRLSGKVMQLNDGSMLIAGVGASELYTVSSDLAVYDADNEAADVSALQTGQNVEVGYDGGVMESYPMQLGQPVYIKITAEGDDLVGFYQTVIDDLWHVDEGLNDNISMLAFDLTQVENLSEGEKSALVYLVSGAYGLEGISGTFDELCDEGYIDRENLYFENGLLFEFELSDVTEESFTFNVKKWRSGLGAYYFHDCKATKSGDGWSYTVGAEMIS